MRAMKGHLQFYYFKTKFIENLQYSKGLLLYL